MFALVFGSALLAVFVRSALPEHHLGAASKDVVKLGIALIATISALVQPDMSRGPRPPCSSKAMRSNNGRSVLINCRREASRRARWCCRDLCWNLMARSP